MYVFVNDYVTPRFRSPYVDGIQHGMDNKYIFGNIHGTEDLTDPDYIRIKNYVLDITENFAKTGVAKTGNITLEKVKGNKVPFAYLQTDISLEENLWPERANFWNEIMNKYKFDWVSAKWTKPTLNSIIQWLLDLLNFH